MFVEPIADGMKFLVAVTIDIVRDHWKGYSSEEIEVVRRSVGIQITSPRRLGSASSLNPINEIRNNPFIGAGVSLPQSNWGCIVYWCFAHSFYMNGSIYTHRFSTSVSIFVHPHPACRCEKA